jgi:5-methylcytosine-specific restriction endonuclease McrBC GTP-binding regulatory subunit McrB
VLWLWSKSSGKDYANTVQLIDLVTPTEKNNQLQLQLEFWTEAKNWPNKSTFQLNWQQVSDIMREEQVKGTVRRDLRWGTPYIQN